MTFSKKYLEQFELKEIQLIEQSDQSLLIMVYFDDMNKAESFYDLLSKEKYKIHVIKANDGLYKYGIHFDNSDHVHAYCFTKNSNIYPQLKLLEDKERKIFISTGFKLNNGDFIQLTKMPLSY